LIVAVRPEIVGLGAAVHGREYMISSATPGVCADRGAAFGLTMELGAAGNSRRRARACEVLWSSALVDGPWLDAASLGIQSRRVQITDACAPDERHYCGVLRIAGSVDEIPFAMHAMSDDSSLAGGNGAQGSVQKMAGPELSDWLTIDVPVALLNRFFRVDRSWKVESQPWLWDLCMAFAKLADHVHSMVPICSGAIGEEISGAWRRPTESRNGHDVQGYPPLALMSANVIETRGGVLVPPDLWNDLRPSVEPIVLPSGLLYAAPRPSVPLLGA
jgi:hypothetical protein